MALAEHYLIVIKGTPTKSELVEMILEEERRREVKKFVGDILVMILEEERRREVKKFVRDILVEIFDRIAVGAFVGCILKKVVDEDERGSSDDGERTPKQEVGQVNVRVLGDRASLARMDTQSQLIPLALFRYGLDLPKGKRPNKRNIIIQSILDHENQVKTILDRDGKNPNPVVNVWRGEDVLCVGSWNMLTLSERTLKKGMERSKHMDIVLDGLNQFDVALLRCLMLGR